jgi:hypothetical protein
MVARRSSWGWQGVEAREGGSTTLHRLRDEGINKIPAVVRRRPRQARVHKGTLGRLAGTAVRSWPMRARDPRGTGARPEGASHGPGVAGPPLTTLFSQFFN